jgi:hypothetical protein
MLIRLSIGFRSISLLSYNCKPILHVTNFCKYVIAKAILRSK